MAAQLYVAVALCIGSPGIQNPPTMNGIGINVCDVGERIEGVDGLTEEECQARLSQMHDRGNIVKFCVPKDSSVQGFQVEWARAADGHRR